MELATAGAGAGDTPAEQLARELDDVEREYARAREAASALHAVQEELRAAEREHELRTAAQRDAAVRAAARVGHRERLDLERATLEQELAQARGDAPSVAARAGQLERQVALLTDAADAARAAEAAARRLKDADARLADAAFRAGFDTPRAAATADARTRPPGKGVEPIGFFAMERCAEPGTVGRVESGGGPLVAVPETVLPFWTAAGRVRLDYDRACEVDGLVGLLPVGDAAALVLGDEPAATAYLRALRPRPLGRRTHGGRPAGERPRRARHRPVGPGDAVEGARPGRPLRRGLARHAGRGHRPHPPRPRPRPSVRAEELLRQLPAFAAAGETAGELRGDLQLHQVHADVDDDPGRPHHLRVQVPEPLLRVRQEAQLVHQPLRVQRPALAVGADHADGGLVPGEVPATCTHCASWRWWPGTPWWYQVDTRSYTGKRVSPIVGSQVQPGREKSSDGCV
ncbi:hypothetical protein SALBM217S_01780 [Streptomyces griseoloalbus]